MTTTKKKCSLRCRGALAAAALALLVSAPAAARPLGRGAAAILHDYVAAIGGEAAFKKHRSLRVKRQISVKGMQVNGTEERWATATNHSLTVTTIPGIGEFRQGGDGKTFWMEDPINGLRKLEGGEAEEARVESTWNAETQLQRLFASVKPVAVPTEAGEGVECLELSGKLTKPAVLCFDAKTHLRAFQKGTHTTPQGEVPYLVRFKDWREAGGTKLPYLEEMTAGPMTMEGRILEVTFDVPTKPAMFALPLPAESPGGAKTPAPSPGTKPL